MNFCHNSLPTFTSNAKFSMEVSSFPYRNFVQFALEETRCHTQLVSLTVQEQFRFIKAIDGKTKLQTTSYKSPKIRLLRSMIIDGNEIQVLDLAVFPEPEYDLPIFCANCFTAAGRTIVVLDLNPLYDTINQMDYKEKYYQNLMPLIHKYDELLPWGGKLTSESLRFFSPIVIWTKFQSNGSKDSILHDAFVDYFKAWLDLMDRAETETCLSQITLNKEAQHRYLTWRAEKDPGYSMLKRLFGERLTKDIVRKFLFNGVDTLGTKSFLDYFPEYRCEDGTVNQRRSIIGKAFETRPWNAKGEFICDDPV